MAERSEVCATKPSFPPQKNAVLKHDTQEKVQVQGQRRRMR